MRNDDLFHIDTDSVEPQEATLSTARSPYAALAVITWLLLIVPVTVMVWRAAF